jgi:hypothetical protein
MVGASGCVQAPLLVNYEWLVPTNFWTTRPVPCDYREIAELHYESYAWPEPREAAEAWLTGAADAIIDYEVRIEHIAVTFQTCKSTPGCDAESGGSFYLTKRTVTGLAVAWLTECSLELEAP